MSDFLPHLSLKKFVSTRFYYYYYYFKIMRSFLCFVAGGMQKEMLTLPGKLFFFKILIKW